MAGILADTPDVEDPTGASRSLADERSKGDAPADTAAALAVRRMGLEQEFFLVDQTGVLRDLADPFLWRCRELASAAGLDPQCFQSECVQTLVEVTTPPSAGLDALARNYIVNVNLALDVASELGLGLYPLGTYPLPITPVVCDDPSYRVKARTIGYQKFLDAGRCVGTHLHLELPPGTVWPDVKAALDAPAALQEELLGVYNLATALDPALVALTRSCPFYEGRLEGIAARTAHYRGISGCDGLYSGLQEVGGLSPYASCVQDLVDQQNGRYRAWFAAMDLAGVERRLFAPTKGNLYRASWNPVRLNYHGTVEIRSMDGNYPETILAVCALVHGAIFRLRQERLRVRPSREVRTFELDGDVLLVPDFSILTNKLLASAVGDGVEDPVVVSYVDSLVKFASVYPGTEEAIEPLRRAGGYGTTEADVLHAFPPGTTHLSRDEGLRLVQDSCRKLREQTSKLRRERSEALRGIPRGGSIESDGDPRSSPGIPFARRDRPDRPGW